MSQVDQKKQAYDRAQLVGERVERMCREAGWREHFIPMIQKKRDQAQGHVNSLESDQRVTDFNRGLLQAYDLILAYEEETLKNQMSIMQKSVKAKMGQ